MSMTMHKILDGVWLGDMAGAYNKITLKKNKITHILTVADGISPKYPSHFTYKVIRILDSPQANIKQYFPTSIQFMKECLAVGGSILVHCFAGVSRSASVVIAFLMQEYGMTYNEATALVKKQRYFIQPNDGFKRQLQQYGRDLKRGSVSKAHAESAERPSDQGQGGNSGELSSTYSGGFGINGGTQMVQLQVANPQTLMMRTLQTDAKSVERVFTREQLLHANGKGPVLSSNMMINNGFSGISGMYLDGRFGLLSTTGGYSLNSGSKYQLSNGSGSPSIQQKIGFSGSPSKFIQSFKNQGFKSHTNHLIPAQTHLQGHQQSSYFSKTNGFKNTPKTSSVDPSYANNIKQSPITLPNFNLNGGSNSPSKSHNQNEQSSPQKSNKDLISIQKSAAYQHPSQISLKFHMNNSPYRAIQSPTINSPSTFGNQQQQQQLQQQLQSNINKPNIQIKQNNIQFGVKVSTKNTMRSQSLANNINSGQKLIKI